MRLCRKRREIRFSPRAGGRRRAKESKVELFFQAWRGPKPPEIEWREAMPIYEYVCGACGTEFEMMQKVGDPPPRRHDCSSRSRVSRKLSLSAFQLKGGGWYNEGYSKGNGDKGSAAESSSSSDGASKPKTDSGAAAAGNGSGGDSGSGSGSGSEKSAKKTEKKADSSKGAGSSSVAS